MSKSESADISRRWRVACTTLKWVVLLWQLQVYDTASNGCEEIHWQCGGSFNHRMIPNPDTI